MKHSLQLLIYGIVSAVCIYAAVKVGMIEEEAVDPGSFTDTEIEIAINLNGYRCGDKLIAGYNYALLKEFTADLGSTAEIRNAFDGESFLDSLKRGSVDLVVLPYCDTLILDSISFSIPVDSLTMWAVRSSEPGALEEVNAWLEEYEQAEGRSINKSQYLRRFSPQRRAENNRTVSALSPYDELIKDYAVMLGWDWRLLAAVIFQESRFHIEAHSPRGARGLMQMLPSTARRFDVEDLLDPEESIKAGVAFLLRLQKMFMEQAATADELCKFTLAAYNAGEGRLRDCINYAQAKGKDASTWDGLVSIIPEMRDEANVQIDSVKLGVFQGHETMAYIDSVLSIYNAFCVICKK